jgi:FkbM family methyltransferase
MFRFFNTRVGPVAHLPTDRCIAASLEAYGEWAHLELSLLRLCLRRGDTVLDVGANVGYHALAFAGAVGPFGRVVGFEPNPAAFRLATLTAAVSDARQVTLHQALVGCTRGVARLRIAEDATNLGATRFLPAEAEAAPDAPPDAPPDAGLHTLTALCLDDFAHLRPALVKIDVEGMQFEVLAGAGALLDAARPVVFFETGGAADRARAEAIFGPRGYRLAEVETPAFSPANLRGATHDIFGGAAERGLLAVPQERAGALAATHPLLAAVLDGRAPDWRAAPDALGWGRLARWEDVHRLNLALAPAGGRRAGRLPDDPPRVFLHIPKTAGTTLTEALRPVYGPQAQGFFPENPFQPDRYDTAAHSFGPGDLVHGHFQLSAPFRAATGARFLTVLRDPVDRALSEFLHGIDRNMRTSFGASVAARGFDWGATGRFDLADYLLAPESRLFFTDTHLRYLGALGERPVAAGDVEATLARLDALDLTCATLPTLAEDAARWLGLGAPLALGRANTRGRLAAGEVFCEATLDRLYAANAADMALLGRLRPDAFAAPQRSSVPDRDEERRRVAALIARYAPGARRAA